MMTGATFSITLNNVSKTGKQKNKKMTKILNQIKVKKFLGEKIFLEK